MAKLDVIRKFDRSAKQLSNPFFATDFLSTTNPVFPFVITNISSGAINTPAAGTVTPGHPGIARYTTSTTTNSGSFIGTNTTQILLGGGEVFNAVFHIVALANTTIRLGFHDATSSADAVDGAYIEIAPTTGVATGKTSSNSSRTSTGTTTTLAEATWYRANISVNADATLVTFSIYNASGVLVWSDTVSATIPTASSRECAAAVTATNSGTSAIDILLLDYMSVEWTKNIIR